LKAADGTEFWQGDRMFNYYAMQAGTVVAVRPTHDGWFDFRNDDGSRDILNGERVCGFAHASRMGWYEGQ
jgi:hypothetical protein